jgi:hypothetical protein
MKIATLAFCFFLVYLDKHLGGKFFTLLTGTTVAMMSFRWGNLIIDQFGKKNESVEL